MHLVYANGSVMTSESLYATMFALQTYLAIKGSQCTLHIWC